MIDLKKISIIPFSRFPLTLACIGVAIVTFAAFFSSLGADFVMWDDDISIYQNELITSLDMSHQKRMFLISSDKVLKYTPLSWESLAITYYFFKLNPFGYHLGNFLFHVGSAILLCYLLFAHLSIVYRHVDRRKIAFVAFLSALIWAVHPLRVDVVALAANRTYCQAVFFLFVSFLFYFQAMRRNGSTIWAFSDWRYWFSVAFLGLSLLTFPVGLTFASAYFLFDIYHFKRLGLRLRRIIIEKIPFVLVSALIFLVNIMLRVNPQGVRAGHPYSEVNIHQVLKASYMWMFYLWKHWIPVNLTPVNPVLIDSGPMDYRLLISAAVLVVISLLLIIYRKKFQGLVLLWFFYLIILLPALGLTEKIHYPAERYSYLPGIIWSFALGSGLCLLYGKSHLKSWLKSVHITVSGGISVLVVLTMLQTTVWQNSVSLFTHILDKLGENPYRADIYWRLGVVHRHQGNLELALNYFQRTLELRPHYPRALFARGITYININDYELAEKDFRNILYYYPNYPNIAVVHSLLADVAVWKNEPMIAARHLRTVLQLGRQTDRVFLRLAQVYVMGDKPEAALKACEKALMINPQNRKAMELMSRLVAKQENQDNGPR